MLPQILTNLEIQKHYQNESIFNGVYSRDNLFDKIMPGTYVLNLDEYAEIGTHWIALYPLNNNDTYFDSFGVKHIVKKIKKCFNRLTTTTNIFRIQAYDSVMCGYFCIGLIDFMLKGKSLTKFTNIFSPNIFKNGDIILNYLKNE